VSAALLDLAVRCEMPIVPVRFAFGLPREPLAERLEFRFGAGAQHYVFGEVIQPAMLRPLNLRDRKTRVIDALNHTGPALPDEKPAAANDGFGARAEVLESKLQLSRIAATLIAALENVPGRDAATEEFLRALHAGRPLHRPGNRGGGAGMDTSESAEFVRLCQALSIEV
jgi:hypothetical protein